MPPMRIVKAFLFPLCLLGLWQAVTASGMVSPYLLPGPSRVLETGLAMAQEGTLARHVEASLLRIAAGFGLSVTLAFCAAAALYRWKLLDELFRGSLSFMRMTPPLALTPLLILWLGIGDATQIAVIVLKDHGALFRPRQNAAAVGLFKAGRNAQQRGLAAARRAEKAGDAGRGKFQ